LRVLEHGIVEVNLVLGLEVVGVGCDPVAIEGRSDVLIPHLDLPFLRLRQFKDSSLDAIPTPDAHAPSGNPSKGVRIAPGTGPAHANAARLSQPA
jgi:hypothetical protein